MRHTDIRVGDRLKLKADNAYGFGPRELTVIAIQPKPGYKVPFVRVSEFEYPYNAFQPRDFQGHA